MKNIEAMTIAIIGGYGPSLINFRGTLLKALVASGHKVYALAPQDETNVSELLEQIGVIFVPVSMNRTGLNPLEDLKTTVSIFRTLRKIKPDIVLPYTIKPVIFGSLAARMSGVKTIISMITGLGYVFGESSGKRGHLYRLVKNLYRISLFFNQAVLFQNPDDLALFRNLKIISGTKEAVVTNGSGVDIDFFNFRPPRTEKLVFLCIARLLKAKGIKEFAEASILLKNKHPEVQFKLVGPHDNGPDGIPEDFISDWTKGGLEYIGPVTDVRPEIEKASVFVLPSYREGTPRSNLEAMAMGRPIITTDTPGCRETVIEGLNGFMVPIKDVGSLVATMERFIRDPELISGMGKESRLLAERRFDVHKVNRIILDAIHKPAQKKLPLVIKRIFDLTVSIPALTVLLPLLILIATAVWLNIRQNVFFLQSRPGKNGTPFKIIKFKTMNEARDESGDLLPDGERLTKLGKFLRYTSLDELPELLNVIKGDMSLVGPRPLLMQYLDRYTPEQARRHEALPGITGWAQVNGRNAISWEEKFKLDVWYVDNRTIFLDIKILFMTVIRLFKPAGINQAGEATAKEFMGREEE